MAKDKTGPESQILNRGKANFEGTGQEVAKIGWESFFTDKGTYGK